MSTFNFKAFFNKYLEIYPEKPLPNIAFLEWLIGFSEGDASFTLTLRRDIHFVITQSTTDVKILNYIRENLGFGSVYLQSLKQKTHRFIVQDLINLQLICLLFNGNFVLPVRNAKFIIFLASLNEKLIKKNLNIILPSYNLIVPTLQDFWLSGFVDAVGCFSVTMYENNNKFLIRFILVQKWLVNKIVLDHILNLFSNVANKTVGYVNKHSQENVWELVYMV